MSPRALSILHGEVSRFGANPKPTVTVRMKEIGGATPKAFMAASQLPHALIHVQAMKGSHMDQLNTQRRNVEKRPGAARIAFIQASWHSEIVDRCRDGFLVAMEDAGRRALVDLYAVPGAFEIPLLAQRLAQGGRHAAVVAAGFVVDGGIYRHEFVAEAVISGLMRVQLDTGIPVLSAVLTPHHFHEHDVHQAFFAGHFEVKGREVAAACLAVTSPAYAEPVAG